MRARAGARRLLTLVLLATIAGCHHARPPEALAPGCPRPTVDTTGWALATATRGRFEILLPRGAHDRLLQCIDSDCGEIAVGSWVIHYDGGPLAGGGDSMPIPAGALYGTACSEAIDGRTVHISAFQFPPGVKENRWSGYFLAQATMRVQPSYPLTLSVISTSPEPVQRFLAAVRTLHLTWP
jgi:hypothetical protein